MKLIKAIKQKIRNIKLWYLLKFTNRIVKNPLLAGSIRNKLCPCMSGKKIKDCHGREEYIDRVSKDFKKILKNLSDME